MALTARTTQLLERQRRFIPQIIDAVSSGGTLRSTCERLRKKGGPSAPTFRLWVVNDSPLGLAERYARARESQAEAWGDEIIERGQRVNKAERVERDAKGKVIKRTIGDGVERDRLAIDSMKWVMSKIHPRRYGEFMDMPAPPPMGPIVITFDPFRNHREIMAEVEMEKQVLIEGSNGHSNGSNGHGHTGEPGGPSNGSGSK